MSKDEWTVPLEGLPPMDDAEPMPPPPAKSSPGKSQTGERFRVLNSFVDCTMGDLSRAEIAVWMILYRDTRDGSARTSMTDISRRAGCSCRAVVDATRRLEKRGLIKVIHRGGIHRGSSRYCVRPLVKCASL